MALDTIENQKWPEDGLERVECCPICGEPDRKLLHAELTDRVFFCAPGQWSLYQCTSCGAGYLDPRPTSDTIGLAYKTYHTHIEEDKIIRGFAQFKRRLSNGYLNAKYKTNLQPAYKIGYFITSILIKKKQEINERARHLPINKKPGILADIGCGNGQFINFAKKVGWAAWGVELDNKAIKAAQNTGANIIKGCLPDTGLPSDYFDLVTLSHVIEHVHDPIAALHEVFRILKPGGQLWLATPNLNSFGHARFAENWRGLEPPRHLVLFNYTNLIYSLQKTNFENIKNNYCRQQASETYQDSYKIIKSQKFKKTSFLEPLNIRYHATIANILTIFFSKNCENIVLTANKPKINNDE